MSAVFSEWLVVLPLLVLLLTGSIAVTLWRSPAQAGIVILGLILYAIASALLFQQVLLEGPQAMAMGNWPAPFGIAFGVDLMGAGLTLTTSIVGLLTAFYAMGDTDQAQQEAGFFPLLAFLLAGVTGAFLTADIFNLYVWFEVILISSFGLMVLGGRREQLDGAVKYAFLNLLATTFFLLATGILYGLTGTLNMADLAGKVGALESDGPVLTLALLYLMAFGMKAAAFPLFFWLPASYHTPNPVVSAVFAGLLTKVGVYALFRVFTLIFGDVDGIVFTAIVAVAIATMVVGVLGALAVSDLRRVLAFTVVGGIGYMLLGLGLQSELAILGGLFYTVHSMVLSAALFMGSGIAHKLGGTTQLSRLSGLYGAAPLFSAFFLMCAFSLAGLPPFSGFWPKFILVQASLEAQAYVAAGAVLISGLLTIIAIGKAWNAGFWRPALEGAGVSPTLTTGSAGYRQLIVPFAMLSLLMLSLGLAAGPVSEIAAQAAADLLDPAQYIEVVLPPAPVESPAYSEVPGGGL